MASQVLSAHFSSKNTLDHDTLYVTKLRRSDSEVNLNLHFCLHLQPLLVGRLLLALRMVRVVQVLLLVRLVLVVQALVVRLAFRR